MAVFALDNAATVNGGSAQDFDWSKPVSSSLKGGSSDDFDWSQPVSTRLGTTVFTPGPGSSKAD